MLPYKFVGYTAVTCCFARTSRAGSSKINARILMFVVVAEVKSLGPFSYEPVSLTYYYNE